MKPSDGAAGVSATEPPSPPATPAGARPSAGVAAGAGGPAALPPAGGPAALPPWVVPFAPPLGQAPRPVRGTEPPGPPPAPPWGAQLAPGWGARPAPPRQRWGRRVLTLLAAVVTLLLVAISLVDRPAREPAAGTARRTGQANAPARSDPAAAAVRLLQIRAKAIVQRDKAAFLSVVDRRRTSFLAAQSRLFDRMATAPFAAFNFRIERPSDDLATGSLRRRYAPARIYLPEVQTRYKFVGQDDSPVLAHVYYTFVQTPEGWRIGAQGEAEPFGTDDTEIWDGGPVRAVRSARTLVVYHPGGQALAQRLLAVADNAYAQIARSWTQPWEGKVVILVPRDQDEAERLVGAEDLSRVAAVSSSSIESVRIGGGRVQGNRIIVNPAYVKSYDRLNLQVVATHEMTHVATRKVGGVPMYLVEGFADYTALRGIPAPLSTTRPTLTREVRQGGFDGTLPADDQFRSGIHASLAYDQGSSFCLWVAQTYGNPRLQDLYRAFAGDRRAGQIEQDQRFRQVLGISLETAEARWSAWVRRQL
jgi:hypothetical protein